MSRELSNCIALGVGPGRLEEAARFYEENLDYVRGEAKDNWIEMKSGVLRLFLVADEFATPTFDLQVEDVPAALAELVAKGCEEVHLPNASPSERFIKDPFGHYYCLSPKT